MTQTNLNSPSKITSAVLIAIGAIFVTLGSQLQMEAQLLDQLSSQGAVMAEEAASEPLLLEQAVLYPAATAPSNAAGTLAFGMLMMLLGFGFHAWIVLRNEEDRTIKVRAADPRKKQRISKPQARKSRKPMEVIWIERTIRF